MPPKAKTKDRAQSEGPNGSEKQSPSVGTKDDSNQSSKRKQSATPDEPRKEARRSGRSQSKSQPSQEQLLDYLLSKESEDLCRPDEELQDIKSRGGSIKTYTDLGNPFEELLCAVILSRPISHRLGLRSIRTILNDPYNFTSAKAVKDAGAKQHHQALWDAKTQHKGKTADQIGQIADVVLEKFTAKGDNDGTQLQKVLDDNDGDVEKALDDLKESIKGLGPTGINIFLRRVQWMWEAGYPYIDNRTGLALRKFGLPEEADDLKKCIDQHWAKLNTNTVSGKSDAAQKRKAFVVILERAIGADLEGKVDQALDSAAK